MSSARVRLPDDAFYRQSRLAAPPLTGDWPVEEVRQFVPTITDEHVARDILQRFYNDLKPLCNEVLAALSSTRLGHGEIEGFAGTDAQWFRQILDGLVSVFEYVLEEGDEEDRIVHVEALRSKLRADVEKHPYDWRTNARTVAEFIIATLREVRVQALSQHINRELLVRSLFLPSARFLSLDAALARSGTDSRRSNSSTSVCTCFDSATQSLTLRYRLAGRHARLAAVLPGSDRTRMAQEDGAAKYG